MELFYDLIIAASMLFLYGSLAKNLSIREFVWLSTIALMLFAIWTCTTLMYNRLPSDSVWRRLFVIVQIVFIVFAIASLEKKEQVDDDFGLLFLGLTLFLLAGMWFVVNRSVKQHERSVDAPVISLVLGGVILIGGMVLADEWSEILVVVTGVIAFIPAISISVPRFAKLNELDTHHLAERLGQLTLIMLGETFLEMAVLYTKGADPRPWGVVLVLGILIIIWWQYFTYVNVAPTNLSPLRINLYLVGHALLVVGLGSAALSLTEIALAIRGSLSLPLLAGLLGASLFAVYCGMTIIVGSTTLRDPAFVPLVIATVVYAVLAVLLGTVFDVDETFTGLLMVAIALATLGATAIAARRTV